MPEVEKINPYGGDRRSKECQVQSMFDNIAPAYDMMNHLMTGFLDRYWLRCLVKEGAVVTPSRIVDFATGTGDVAFALARRLPQASVTGLDLSEGMLDKAREKAAGMETARNIRFVQGDCLATGLPENSADVITIAYGVRNFADIAAGYREMMRILRPGGKLCVLELSAPTGKLTGVLYRVYAGKVIPAVGRLLSHDNRAYSYLPESIAAVPSGGAMLSLINDAGFVRARFRRFTFGVCTLYTAYKPL